MHKRIKYQWQGKPVRKVFGYCKVEEEEDKPLWWWNYECCWDDYEGKPKYSAHKKFAIIPAIKVTYEDQVFCIANHFGIGASKLKKGGWPNHAHFSLPVDAFEDKLSQSESIMYNIREFDELGYSRHEANRDKWQKSNFPEEYEKMESFIRKMGINK